MASRIERQAASYLKRPVAKSAATPAPARNPPPPRPLSQRDRQALTYKYVAAGTFKKFTQETGLSEEQARKVVNWLVADEPKR